MTGDGAVAGPSQEKNSSSVSDPRNAKQSAQEAEIPSSITPAVRKRPTQRDKRLSSSKSGPVGPSPTSRNSINVVIDEAI